MRIAKRIILFLTVNFIVVLTLSLLLQVLGVRPYINAYGIDYQSLMIFCLIWGFGGAFISLSLSRKIAKWMLGVKIINPDTTDAIQHRLISTVHNIARTANIPMPQVGIYHSPSVNAFATGPSQKRSLVAVSSAMLENMNQKELEGVLAHEISHISNGDMVTMTLIQGIINAFVLFLARVVAFAITRNTRESRRGSMSYFWVTYMLEAILMILGSIIVANFSRRREFRADRGSADLVGRDKMIAALEKLQQVSDFKDPRKTRVSMAALQISTKNKGGFLRLFATHPPLQDRIERLKSF